MFSLTGDVVIQSAALVAAAVATAWGAVAAARRSGRAARDSSKAVRELVPNGGSSVRDAIDRIENRLSTHDSRFERIERHMDQRGDVVDGQLSSIANTLEQILDQHRGSE